MGNPSNQEAAGNYNGKGKNHGPAILQYPIQKVGMGGIRHDCDGNPSRYLGDHECAEPELAGL